MTDSLSLFPCPHGDAHLGFIVFGNGSKHLIEWCPTCRTSLAIGGQYLPQAGRDLSGVPVVCDLREGVEPCEVCESMDGVELHHWAPAALSQYFADDHNRWPTGWLCRKCHALWHRVVTPDLCGDASVGEILPGIRKSTSFRALIHAARTMGGAPK